MFDNRGWSPLHEAAYGGWSGCLEFLLRHRKSISFSVECVFRGSLCQPVNVDLFFLPSYLHLYTIDTVCVYIICVHVCVCVCMLCVCVH